MRLVSAGRLAQYMEDEGFTQSRLARYAGCSRQFVHLLVTGQKNTCTERLAHAIEEALRANGALFDRRVSAVTRHRAKERLTPAASGRATNGTRYVA